MNILQWTFRGLGLPGSARLTYALLTPYARSCSERLESTRRQKNGDGLHMLALLVQQRWHSTATRERGVLEVPSNGPYSRAGEQKPKHNKVFDKLLVANRGEIACRVMRTCRRLQIKTVAIHSEPDEESLHVRLADEAVCVGPAASAKSYLNVDAVIAACKSTGAQAVHPGYGFLSENAAFVKRLEAEGIAFVGPTSSAIAAMGDKIESKALATQAKVNIIPGLPDVIQDVDHAVRVAKQVGFPIMMKASAGGGGKGMRIAWDVEEARQSFDVCKGEAVSSFGDGRIFIERFIDQPRHIEIQLMADSYGNAVWLPERECSIQRRNQKVIEEAPSVFLDHNTREAMGQQAVQLAKAVGYRSAGTVEFLVDKHRNFYFLEMNTRLQVEHPVTEEITGLDLVECMLRVAAGDSLADLGLTQKRASQISGWALESRVYAEDPRRGFLPSNGRLRRYVEPLARSKDERVRVDSGVFEGSDISIYYDPLISKLVSWGPTRDEAIRSMESALDSYVIRGVTHNTPFLRSVVSHPAFKAGKLTTRFLKDHFGEWEGSHLTERQRDELMAIAALLYVAGQQRARSINSGLLPELERTDLVVTIDGEDETQIRVWPLLSRTKEAGEIAVEADFGGRHISVTNSFSKANTQFVMDLMVDGTRKTCQILDQLPRGFRLLFAGGEHDILVQRPYQAALARYMPPPVVLDFSKVLRSPMPGALISVSVDVGQPVSAGDELAVVEAMKMRNVLRAERPGVVKAVPGKEGSIIAQDEVIIEFE